MAKKENKNSKQASSNEAGVPVGEQMPLIDVSPEHSKEIVKIARAYRKSASERQSCLAEEVKLKNKLLALVKEEHLQRLEDGTIKFTVEGFTITITPRDEKVTVKEDSEAA